MNRRFQVAERKCVGEFFAQHELYVAIKQIGDRLEAELKGFGLCPEECLMETLELLSTIAQKGRDVESELDDCWWRKYNEYRCLDRQVAEDEDRKAVGIVFGFAALALNSSVHSLYNNHLPEVLMQVVARHKFEGWAGTLGRIFDVPMAEGWFDRFLAQGEDSSKLEEMLDQAHELQQQSPSVPIVLQIIRKQYNEGCQQFMGTMYKPQINNNQQS